MKQPSPFFIRGKIFEYAYIDVLAFYILVKQFKSKREREVRASMHHNISN